MLLDRQRAKFWQRVVFAFMAFLMVASLVTLGIAGLTCQKGQQTDQIDAATASIDTLAAALKANPASAQAILDLAGAYVGRGNLSADGSSGQKADMAKAVALYEQYLGKKDAALGADPKTARLLALQSLVAAHTKLGDTAGVLADWNRIVDLQPRSVENWLFLATAAQSAGKNAVALLAFQKALDLDPNGQYATEIKAQIKTLEAQVKSQTPAPQSSPTSSN